MEAERSDGGEAEVADEFACAGMLHGSLTSLHGTVERIFGVAFDIGESEASHASDGQIWLKLRGRESDVQAAKLFVKGVVNQEEQQEVAYPNVLHCVFCGARGLFIHSLIRNTSAQIIVGSMGYLLISGLAEPVVRAYSLITDLVERYECTQSRSAEPGERGSSESLESRRAFKILVEKWEDRHTLDLLVLPGAVKEVLLDLVRESGLGMNPGMVLTPSNERRRSDGYSDGKLDSTTCRWDEGMTAGTSSVPTVKDYRLAGLQGREESNEGRLSPQEPEGQDQSERVETLDPPMSEEPGQEDEQELQFLLLLKFFTAMGYTEDVVKGVLAKTGPKEASQILDLVQQEQDHADYEQATQARPHQDLVVPSERERNRPCESEHREDGEPTAGGRRLKVMNGEIRDGEGEGANGHTSHPQTEDSSAKRQEEGHEEDFVLGVLKKAAVSCGYTEQKVAEVYSMLPNHSTHQLLLELQKDDKKEAPDTFREGPREIDDVGLEKWGPNFRPAEGGTREGETSEPSGEREPVDLPGVSLPKKHTGQEDVFDWNNKPDHFTVNQYTSKKKPPSKLQSPHQNTVPEVKGPPMSTYCSSLEPTHNSKTKNQHKLPSMNKMPQSSNSFKQAQSSILKDFVTPRAKEQPGFMGNSLVVVTGEQRFLEGLQTPFTLQLTDRPGDKRLRSIIIDGSNVAMSHGLSHFFSCRGIALAVQHFWDRGHRDIITFLPQWRQKHDPNTKEQHYLTELQSLGLLAYTPSREVQGKRISSYDDRFMLQRAQKTNGVIVTNDNLRDLLDDSPAWRDIIKKRLLQYTFVGDHFMVPDDPLGRGGPHLNDFLRLNHSSPQPGCHSFAGTATANQSSRAPRSQTEVLNFRDRTTGNTEAGNGKTWDRPRHLAGPARDRSLEETAVLREQLCQVFANQDNVVVLVLQCHPAERDINVLSDLILEQQKD